MNKVSLSVMLFGAFFLINQQVMASEWTEEERKLFRTSTQVALADVLQTYQFTRSGALREANPLLSDKPSVESLVVSTLGGQAAVYGIADAIPQGYRARALRLYKAVRYGVIVSNETLMYSQPYLEGEDRINEPDFAIGFKINFK